MLLAFCLALGLFPLLLLYVAVSAYRASRSKAVQQSFGYSTASAASKHYYGPVAAPVVAPPLPYTPAPLSVWLAFWLLWTLMNGLGWAAAALVPVFAWANHAAPEVWVIGCVVMALLIGMAQWLVLREQSPTVNYWILATLIGFFIAIPGAGLGLFGSFLAALFMLFDGKDLNLWGFVLPAFATSGLFLGLAQRGAIRKLPMSGWWLIVTTFAWCVGGAIFLSMMGATPEATGFLNSPIRLVAWLLGQGILSVEAIALAGAASGAVSGLPLFWILRHQVPALQTNHTLN